MNNFKQHGDRITVTLAVAAVSGVPQVVGTGLIGIPVEDGEIGDTIDFAVKGVFELPKVSGAVIALGEQVTFDVSAGEVNDDQEAQDAGDFLCGYAWEAAGNGVLAVSVKINEPAPAVT